MKIMNLKYYLIIILSLLLIPSINAQKSSSKKKKKQQQETIITIDSSSISVTPKKIVLPNMIYDLYVKDALTKNPVPNCRVTLTGSDSSIVVKYTDSIGKVVFENDGDVMFIKRETSYNVKISKFLYVDAFERFSTLGGYSKRFVHEVFLKYEKDTVYDLPEIQFAYDKSDLLVIDGKINSYDSLDFLYQLMIDNPTIIIEIQNHSDCRGKAIYSSSSGNTQRRAQACVDYLVSKGIPQERLVAKGYGNQVPRGPGLDCESIKKLPTKEEQELAHQKNRRVQFRVLSFEYKPTDN